MTRKTTVYGWPLVPSERWPGEKRAACPKCGGTVTLGSLPGGRGTGPGGRWRLGDPGGLNRAWCEACGENTTWRDGTDAGK